ncbi:MAG TPA: hypothetical protein VFN57_16750 [Thermomicrobiaceae bacterium]|nr:hypothetical protein [Thermomicrobiaceae bacterium]
MADPTPVSYSGPQTFASFCSPYPGAAFGWPLAASSPDDIVYAGLDPGCQGETTPPADVLARFFQ